jgi:hypothetical protein
MDHVLVILGFSIYWQQAGDGKVNDYLRIYLKIKNQRRLSLPEGQVISAVPELLCRVAISIGRLQLREL